MSKPNAQYKVILSPSARKDIRELLSWSVSSFGVRAASRYRALLNQAFRDLEADPTRPGSRTHPGLAEGASTYHLAMSRGRGDDQVKEPRHQIVYRVRASRIEIARVLYDSRDIFLHLPDDYRPS